MNHTEPVLETTAVADLRPTQMTVGFREVAEKRREWRNRVEKDGPEFLGRHMIPVLKGPKNNFYVVDHHHLAHALQLEGVKEVAVNVIAELNHLGRSEFWTFCDNRAWCHPYDDEGVRQDFSKIPKTLDGMKDDPYRSLAGELRRAGGCSKDTAPFAEFIWADFLRRRVKLKLLQTDFAAALTKALTLARTPQAGYLPGWCGPSPID